MKKVAAIVLTLGVMMLAGCTTSNDEFEKKLTDLEAQITALEDEITALETELSTVDTENDGLVTDLASAVSDLETANALLADLTAEYADLEMVVATTNSRISNALNRDNWVARKVRYNPDFTSYEAEYCFGIFDTDWSLIEANDYTEGEGLLFVITIEKIQWGTEIFVKDSCGNYSDFIYQNSPYSMYSIPAGFFEEGKTYEVVLYKDVYFTVDQLGLLPVTEMGDYGSYPEDLSGIIAEEVQ